MTAVWAIVGLLCSIGVILAVLDPSLTGSASATSVSDGGYTAPLDDDGFVAPPRKAPRQVRKQPAPAAEVDTDALAQRAACLFRADAQIARQLAKVRAESKARKAARRAARLAAKAKRAR